MAFSGFWHLSLSCCPGRSDRERTESPVSIQRNFPRAKVMVKPDGKSQAPPGLKRSQRSGHAPAHSRPTLMASPMSVFARGGDTVSIDPHWRLTASPDRKALPASAARPPVRFACRLMKSARPLAMGESLFSEATPLSWSTPASPAGAAAEVAGFGGGFERCWREDSWGADFQAARRGDGHG